MKISLKENWFKLIIAICVIVLTFGYLWSLNARKKRLDEKEVFDRYIECNELEMRMKEFYDNIEMIYYNPLIGNCVIETNLSFPGGMNKKSPLPELPKLPKLPDIPELSDDQPNNSN